MSNRRRRDSSTPGPTTVVDPPRRERLIDLVGLGLLFLVVFNALFARFLPNQLGFLGHDYAYALPNLLAGQLWIKQNGIFSLPWFTPAFCGGVPAFPNPQNPFYSLPQLIGLAFDPLRSVHITLLVFAWLGYAGFYLLLRDAFRTSRPAALLGAVLFMFNDFYAYRVVVGHLSFHPFMLVPWVALLLLPRHNGRVPRLQLLPIATAGALIGYMVLAGMAQNAVPALLSIALIGVIHTRRHGGRQTFWVSFAGAAAVAVLLSLAKLSAVAAFLHNLPRDYYLLPGASSLWGGLKLVFESLFIGPPVAAARALLVNREWTFERHEFEYGVTFVPLLAMLLWGSVTLWRRRLAGFAWRRPSGLALLETCGIAVALIVPILFNWYSPGWNHLLKQIPIIKSSSSLLRWFCVYIPLAVLAAPLALDALLQTLPARKLAAALGIVACLVVKFSADGSFYQQQGYDPQPVLSAYSKLELTSPEIATVENTGSGNDGVAYGISQANCYEPIFGYRREHFPTKNLTAGPALADVGGVLNIKNPACYVFPTENGCTPGDHFSPAQLDAATAFVHYRPYPFELPGWQVATNTVTMLTLLALLLVWGAAGLRWFRQRQAVATRPSDFPTQMPATTAPSPPPTTSATWQSTRTAMAALALFGVVVSYGSYHNPFLLDDGSKIVENPDIRDLGQLPERLIYPYTEHQLLNRNDPSRPLVSLTYALNYAVGGLSSFGYHVVNALLHALNGVLVFLLALRLFGKTMQGARETALAVALLFLSAPINMGTTIYVYGRSDVMQATCFFAATLLFIMAREGRRHAYAGCIAAFVVGLFTKQSMVVLPALLLGLDYLVLSNRDLERLKAQRRDYVPFIVITLAYLVFRWSYFGTLGDVEGRGNLWRLTQYVAVEPYVIARYLGLSLWPSGLSIDHQVLPFDNPLQPILLVGWLVLAALIGGLLYLARRREAWAVALLFAGWWFFVSLAPTSSLAPTVDAMVERRVYAPNFGFYVVVVLLVRLGLEQLAGRVAWLRAHQTSLFRAVIGTSVLAFSAVTLERNQLFSSPEAVWKSVITNYPKSVRAHNNLANIYQGRGEFAQAIAIYEQLVEWNPTYYIEWNNLGSAYAAEDNPAADPERAQAAFAESIRLNPKYAEPYYNAARLYQRRGDAEHAEPLYHQALAIDPNHVLAHNNLGLLYFHQGKTDEARRELETALRLDPSCAPALANIKLLEGGPPPSAVQQPGTTFNPADLPSNVLVPMFEDALRHNPHDRDLRRIFAGECLRRKLPCAKQQYGELSAEEPNNQEYRRILDALP